MNSRSMGFGSCAVVACATAIVATSVLVLNADARTRKDERYGVRPVERSAQPLSLDGRNTGRSRTCGFETFQYDNRGVPYGPYCH